MFVDSSILNAVNEAELPCSPSVLGDFLQKKRELGLQEEFQRKIVSLRLRCKCTSQIVNRIMGNINKYRIKLALSEAT